MNSDKLPAIRTDRLTWWAIEFKRPGRYVTYGLDQHE